MNYLKSRILSPLLFAVLLVPASASSVTALELAAHAPLSTAHLVQYRECSQRVGPFVTQSTAWQRLRQAQGQGYAVSNGVFPCYSGGSRGYCFNVFYSC